MKDQYDASQLTEAAAIFQALSDPARLHTLTLLAATPSSVSQLAEAMQGRIGTVSARLKSRVRHLGDLVSRRAVANFTVLVLGCFDASDSKNKRIFQRVSR